MNINEADFREYLECVDKFARAVTGKPLSEFAEKPPVEPERRYVVVDLGAEAAGSEKMYVDFLLTHRPVAYSDDNGPPWWTHNATADICAKEAFKKHGWHCEVRPWPEPPVAVKFAARDRDGALWHYNRNVSFGAYDDAICDSDRKPDMTRDEAERLIGRLNGYEPYVVVGFDKDGNELEVEQ